MKVSEAIEVLSTTYQSVESVARGLEVDANEVAKAFAEAKPDTTEYVVLEVLARLNPVKTVKAKKQDDNNTEQSGLT